MAPTLNTAKYVTKGAVSYLCKRQVRHHSRGADKFWRCGCCDRGKLYSWDKECKVCKAKVFRG